MDIQIICPHFAPDVAPTGEVMTAIATELVARGHRLRVVTSFPWYHHHALEPGWGGQLWRHEDVEWGRITRVHPFPTDKDNVPARALAFGGFTALAGALALARPHPDVVFAMSPPLTLGLAGRISATRHGVPYIFNIQDVFPDVLIELGMMSNPQLIAASRWLERTCYRMADAVTVLSEDLADNVRAKLGSPPKPLDGDPVGISHLDKALDKVRVIPNFVDTERIVPGEPDNAYRREYGLTGRTVVMYAGNIGHSQSLDLVVDAAAALEASRPDVVFVINGEGVARDELRRRAEGLANVVFVDMQPRERLAEVLAAGDIHVVPLRTGLARSSVPSKLYSILAAGRPVVASVDPGTEVAVTIERAGAGMSVGPDDPRAFTEALSRLLDSPAQAASMGRAGREFVESWASPAAVAGSYEKLFEELVERRRLST